MDAGSAASDSAHAPCEAHYAAVAGSAAAQPTLVGSAQPLKLRGVMRPSTSLAAIGLAVSAVLSSGSARAADRALDQLSTEAGSVVIQFGCPMSFVSNYPLRTGDELRIELQPLPGWQHQHLNITMSLWLSFNQTRCNQSVMVGLTN